MYYPIATRQGADITLPRKPHTRNSIYVKILELGNGQSLHGALAKSLKNIYHSYVVNNPYDTIQYVPLFALLQTSQTL
jgi:hypothetical protein